MTAELQHKIENLIRRTTQADDRDVMFQLKQLFYETELQSFSEKEAKNITNLVAENIQQLDSEIYQKMIIKSGFDDFDRAFGGFRLGEFIVVGGRPSMGKTQFMINLSLNISITVPVLYVTLDESEFLLTNRFIATVSEIPAFKILRHRLNEGQKEKLSTIGDEFTKHQLFIHDSCNSSIAALKANCLKQIRENGVQVIFIDYLQRITSYRYKVNSRELEINYICRELQNIAKEYNVCVVVSSQLSRGVETRAGARRPVLSDLRDSGAIEQDADMVLFIYRPEYYGIEEDEHGDTAGKINIIVAKNRNGHLGEFILMKDENCTNFRNLRENFEFLSDRLNELTEGFPY
jgi:replicative DNA helicase